MSYIDDLNQAASEALAASASATESSQIIYDVANGDENTTVTTANGEVKTLAKAIADISNELYNSGLTAKTEEIVLSSGQTSVTLSEATTLDMELYVEGVREFDFTVESGDTFTLSEALPDGTRIWVVGTIVTGGIPERVEDIEQQGILEWSPLTSYTEGALCKVGRQLYQLADGGDGSSDPSTDGGVNWAEIAFGDPSEFTLTDDNSVSRTASEWASGQVYSYATLADALADDSLKVGAYVQTSGYSSPLDGGANRYLCVASGTGVDDGGRFIDHPNSPVQLKGIFPSGEIRIEQFGVVKSDRSSAVSNASGINASIKVAGITGLPVSLGGGIIFFTGQITADNPVEIKGAGVGYWANQPAGNLPNLDLPRAPAPTQLVATGDFPRDNTYAGVSSMRASGADRINGSARAGHNDDIYRLYSFMNDDGTLKEFSIALLVDSEGVHLSDFRLIPDFGGDDGLEGYSSKTETNWSDCDCDFGLWMSARHHNTVARVDCVGHWRGAGLHASQVRANWRETYPGAGYRNIFEDCTFQGYRGAMVRGSDRYYITGVTSTTITVPYSPDSPLVDGAMTALSWNSNGLLSNFLPVPSGVTNDGAAITLTFDSALSNPPSVGDDLFTVNTGGGNSHLTFIDCVFTGMANPSGVQCTDQTLPEPMPHPSSGFECSGWRGTEMVMINPQFQSMEEVHFHFHDAAKTVIKNAQFESNSAAGFIGARLIASPNESLNTHATYPSGQTYRLLLESNNTWDDPNVDYRPAAPVNSRFASGSDDGFFEPNQLVLPSWTGSYCGSGPFLRPAGEDGRAGIKKNTTHPFSADAFSYGESEDALTAFVPLRSESRGYITEVTGTMSSYEIVDGMTVSAYIPDNTYMKISFTDDVISGMISVAPTALQKGAGVAVAGLDGNTTNVTKIGGTSNFATLGGVAMTGTTGTDGNLTVGAEGRSLYVENRTGSQGRYTISII